MKLRSLSEFEEAIDRETAWRKRELTTVIFAVRGASPKQQGYVVRAGVALLYAHWEGWIKSVASYYLDHVYQTKLKYTELASPMLAAALRTRVLLLSESKSPRVHLDFAEFIQTQMETRASLRPESLVRAESNLSSAVLEDIAICVGISFAPYELNRKLIDEALVRTRNRIAHGEFEAPTLDDFLALYPKVVEMLNAFTTDVMNTAATAAYRRVA
ncbi:MAG TPA: MAE_28990/MAE_18760 family HEPN-like nuclease [Gaiellaceae bacterium]